MRLGVLDASAHATSTSYALPASACPWTRSLRHAALRGQCLVAKKAQGRGHGWHRLRSSEDAKEPSTAEKRNTAAPELRDQGALGSSSATKATSDGAGQSSPESDPSAVPATMDPGAMELVSMWESLKQDMRKQLGPEEAQVLDSIKVDDLLGDRPTLMRKVADEQLGPILASLGISEDPFTFFLDLLRLATSLQLLSAGVLFYGTELIGGYDSGEAFRCVAGLTAGYLSRPFLRVENVLWPLYDWVLHVFVPGAEYKVSASAEDTTSTLSRLGVAVAVCSLLPQLLWGWDTRTCLQFVLPLAAGWLLFDVMYMAALLSKVGK